MMLDLVVENTFSLDSNSQEFRGILRYLHKNRIILYFSQIESLQILLFYLPTGLLNFSVTSLLLNPTKLEVNLIGLGDG